MAIEDYRFNHGFVYRDGVINVLMAGWVNGIVVGRPRDDDPEWVETTYRPPNLTRDEGDALAKRCLRDTLVYETDKKGPKQYTEHDFPLTPERPIGRFEGECCPKNSNSDEPGNSSPASTS